MNVKRAQQFGYRAAVVLATLATLFMASNDATAQNRPRLWDMLPSHIQKAGEITAASDTNFPPHEYMQPGTNTLVGLDVDIAKGLEAALGVPIRFVSTGFDGIIPALQARRYDVGISAINDTVERQKIVDMVNYMVNPGTSATVLAGNPLKIRAEMDLCGKAVAVLSGTTQEKQLQKIGVECRTQGKPLRVATFPEITSGFLALQSGQADAMVTGGIAAAFQVEQSAGKLEAVRLQPTLHLYSIAVRKGNEQLVAALKAGLEEMKRNGSYKAILAKWGASKYGVDAITVNKVVVQQ